MCRPSASWRGRPPSASAGIDAPSRCMQQEAGQAQGSNDLAMVATPRGTRLCTRSNASRSRATKDEEARPTVNGGRPPVTPARRQDGPPSSGQPAVYREQGFEGQDPVTGTAAAYCSKRHEPHDWNSGAKSGEGRGGASRQGGGKPRRRNMGSVGDRSPKRARLRARGSGLLGSQDGEGAVFGNSDETS